jgi:TolB-like protein
MGEKRNQRLDSWKEIASYLGRDVRTVIRWEKQRQLPVHRVPGGRGHAVFAYSDEVDSWLVGHPPNGKSADTAPRPMVAVLPFLNGHGPQSEYLSDGLTESVIRSLGHWPKLRVMAWSAVAPYKNRTLDPRRVGNELNAKAVLMGRVALEEDRWRVNVELVDPRDGAQIWGTSYARSFDQILAVPERIAGEVARRLQDADPPARATRPAPKPEAFRQYLMGRYCWNQTTGESMQKAVGYYEEAI